MAYQTGYTNQSDPSQQSTLPQTAYRPTRMPSDMSTPTLAPGNAEIIRYPDTSPDRHQKYYGIRTPPMGGYAKMTDQNIPLRHTNPNVGVIQPSQFCHKNESTSKVTTVSNEKQLELSEGRQSHTKLNIPLSDGGTEIQMKPPMSGQGVDAVNVKVPPLIFSPRQSQAGFMTQPSQSFYREAATNQKMESPATHIPQHMSVKSTDEPTNLCVDTAQNIDSNEKNVNQTHQGTLDYSQRKSEQLPCDEDRSTENDEHLVSEGTSKPDIAMTAECEKDSEGCHGDKELQKDTKAVTTPSKPKNSHKKKKRYSTEAGSPFTCDTCEKQFNESKHLARHKLLHSKERQHKCSVCSMAFVRADHQRRHEKTHTGERPYGCQVCGKAFTRASHLKRHKRIHTGDRPYVCDQCDKSYIDPSHLARHKLSHSK